MRLQFTFSNLYVNAANVLITQSDGAPGELDLTQLTGLLTHFCSTLSTQRL